MATEKPKEISRTYRYLKTSIELEERKDGGLGTINGYASVFYNPDDPGTEFELFEGLVERIMPGTFDKALKERKDDVRALFNHDPDHILGRTTAGTLRLSTDKKGLRYSIDLPNTQLGNDLKESIKRGDINGSSFGFMVTDQRFETKDEIDIRMIEGVELFDVGPVTYPAFTATTAEAKKMPDDMLAEAREARDAFSKTLIVVPKVMTRSMIRPREKKVRAKEVRKLLGMTRKVW